MIFNKGSFLQCGEKCEKLLPKVNEHTVDNREIISKYLLYSYWKGEKGRGGQKNLICSVDTEKF